MIKNIIISIRDYISASKNETLVKISSHLNEVIVLLGGEKSANLQTIAGVDKRKVDPKVANALENFSDPKHNPILAGFSKGVKEAEEEAKKKEQEDVQKQVDLEKSEVDKVLQELKQVSQEQPAPQGTSAK